MKSTVHYEGFVKTIARQGLSEIVCSGLTQIESTKKESPGYAIKYVASGKERYIVKGHNHDVCSGQYLLLNKAQVFECNFQSDQPVQGFCITLDESVLSGVYNVLSSTEDLLLDNPCGQPNFIPGLHELVYTRGNSLGAYIHTLYQQILAGNSIENPYALFYEIAGELLKAQSDVDSKLNRLKATKLSTRKELFSRLESARQLLEECKDTSLKIQEVAQQATLSEFHFYRSFKLMYGVSPHQFLVRKKIERAASLIARGHDSITDIAYMTGFADIYSFSRSFRQLMGISPSSYRISKSYKKNPYGQDHTGCVECY